MTNGRHAGWIVLLEAAPDGNASLVDVGTVRVMLEAMGDEEGVALHAADRVALQVHMPAADAGVALAAALAQWRRAAEAAPAGWDVVRAEVLTLDEFKRDCERG